MDWQAIWDWLSDPTIQATLSWIGGGFVVVIGGAWIAFTFFWQNKRDDSPPVQVTADQLVKIIEAAKRDPAQDRQHLTAEQKRTIDALEQKLGVSEGAIRAFFRALGEANVPLEQLEERLVKVAEDYKRVKSQVSANPDDPSEVAALKREARAALDSGDLDRADSLLEQVIVAEEAALEKRQLEAARTSALRGDIALTRLRYREAAQHFATAAKRVPSLHTDEKIGHLRKEASTLYRQGHEFGDNAALAESIDRYMTLLNLRGRNNHPIEWAMTQNDLGNALQCLGERESGTARLEEAVAAHREALKEYTRERVPLQWATTQNNLGNAFQCLGTRESGTARLEEAVAAYREALK
ncbi:tetratricopeptide repeat protein, partial [Pelagibius sp.]|uniref:tetratricopeptide repeat protein n=1 Tax=Pelagibius sp. TaxID=1931238 RepID=UPI00260F0623